MVDQRHTNTKEQIIDLGRELVQQLGFHSFRYQLIAKQLNIKNAAIHHYFPAKEDLNVAIIERDNEDFKRMSKSWADVSPAERMERFIKQYRSYLVGGSNLCVIGACASAHTEMPERMRLAADKYVDDMGAWLAATLKEGREKGQFTFTGKPEHVAALWTATLPGTLQLSQFKGEKYFDQVVSQLRKSLE